MKNKRAYFRKYLTKEDSNVGSFCPTPLQVSRAHTVINECIFGGKLKRPKIEVKYLDDAWGLCYGDLDDGAPPHIKPRCNYIAINNSFYNWRHFIEVLAHEMVHQYQVEILNKMDHGKTFWAWKDKFERYNLKLRISYGRPRKSAKLLK